MGDRETLTLRKRAISGRPATFAAWLPLLLCCASAPEVGTPPAPAALPRGALRVQLVFGEAADLDLYVTDPALETVYFANTPSTRGGELEADVRCDTPAPRVETVTFTAAAVGRYRVGVDFPARCRRSADEAAYVVRIEGGGLNRLARGTLRFGRFEPSVLEFFIEP